MWFIKYSICTSLANVFLVSLQIIFKSLFRREIGLYEPQSVGDLPGFNNRVITTIFKEGGKAPCSSDSWYISKRGWIHLWWKFLYNSIAMPSGLGGSSLLSHWYRPQIAPQTLCHLQGTPWNPNLLTQSPECPIKRFAALFKYSEL